MKSYIVVALAFQLLTVIYAVPLEQNSEATEGNNGEQEQENTEERVDADENPPILKSGAGVVCTYDVTTLGVFHEDFILQPDQITLELCDNLMVSYVEIDYENLSVVPVNADDEKIFSQLIERKTENIKVMLEIYPFAYYSEIGQLLTSEKNIHTFVSSTIDYLKNMGFDGMKLPMLLPDENEEGSMEENSDEKSDDKKDEKSDDETDEKLDDETDDKTDVKMDENEDKKETYSPEAIKLGYSQLVQELEYEMSNYNLILCAQLPHDGEKILKAYDLSMVTPLVAWYSVYTMRYDNPDDGLYLQHISPLTAQYIGDKLYVDYTILFLITDLLIPSDKIVLEIPFSASTFVLALPEDREIGAPVKDVGPPGSGTFTKGVLSLSEICILKNTEWLTSDIMTDYDDPFQLAQKVTYAKGRKLSGINIVSITFDDPSGDLCQKGIMPFTRICSWAWDTTQPMFQEDSTIPLSDFIDPYDTNKFVF